MKKVFSLVLILCLVMSVFSVIACAATANTLSFTFTNDNGGGTKSTVTYVASYVILEDSNGNVYKGTNTGTKLSVISFNNLPDGQYIVHYAIPAGLATGEDAVTEITLPGETEIVIPLFQNGTIPTEVFVQDATDNYSPVKAYKIRMLNKNNSKQEITLAYDDVSGSFKGDVPVGDFYCRVSLYADYSSAATGGYQSYKFEEPVSPGLAKRNIYVDVYPTQLMDLKIPVSVKYAENFSVGLAGEELTSVVLSSASTDKTYTDYELSGGYLIFRNVPVDKYKITYKYNTNLLSMGEATVTKFTLASDGSHTGDLVFARKNYSLDFNESSEFDATDYQVMVNAVLQDNPSSVYDIDLDGVADVLDVVYVERYLNTK